jgi:DNA-binding transcriptional MerR regulator
MNRAILFLMKKGGGHIGKDLMKIGELAKRSGVSTRTIDYYTNFGLLDVQRSESNYRLYPLSAIQTIERIQLLKKQRLTISEIKEILNREETINSEVLAESVFKEFESLQQKNREVGRTVGRSANPCEASNQQGA